MKRFVRRVCLFLILLGCALPSSLLLAATKINVNTPMSPPVWALLERELIRANTAACEEFFARYFDDRGYLLCVTRWGGDDGPDDSIENRALWPELYAVCWPAVGPPTYLSGPEA